MYGVRHCFGGTTLVRTILHDEKRILPCSAPLDGEYGESGIFCGVPAVIGANGVEKVMEYNLTEEELARFKACCATIARISPRATRSSANKEMKGCDGNVTAFCRRRRFISVIDGFLLKCTSALSTIKIYMPFLSERMQSTHRGVAYEENPEGLGS
ncbi:MAG: hypothetical protein ACLUIQ_12330 [Dialister invisus]